MATRKSTRARTARPPRSTPPTLSQVLEQLSDARAVLVTATDALEAAARDSSGPYFDYACVLRNGLQLLQHAYNGLDEAITEGDA